MRPAYDCLANLKNALATCKKRITNVIDQLFVNNAIPNTLIKAFDLQFCHAWFPFGQNIFAVIGH
jgi:hypothetical protein